MSTTFNDTYATGQRLNILCVRIYLVAVIATRPAELRYHGRPIVIPTVGKQKACLLRDSFKVRENRNTSVIRTRKTLQKHDAGAQKRTTKINVVFSTTFLGKGSKTF